MSPDLFTAKPEQDESAQVPVFGGLVSLSTIASLEMEWVFVRGHFAIGAGDLVIAVVG